MTALGTIDELFRYPVKSMAGETLAEAYISYTGVTGDRVYGFVDRAQFAEGSNFPWFTIREYPEMLLYRAKFATPLSLDQRYPDEKRFDVIVTTPDGLEGRLDDEAFVQSLRQRFGNDFLVRFSEKGMQDARPISLFSDDTLSKLGDETRLTLDRRRFRANIYAKWLNQEAFFEDGLVGKHLKVGKTCELFVQKKDPRCRIISIDPEQATEQPEVLRTVAKQHRGCVGVYCVVIREGLVRKGDPIVLL